MNLTIVVGATNCCDMNICHTSCPMIGHITLLGWIMLFTLSIGIGILVRVCGKEP